MAGAGRIEFETEESERRSNIDTNLWPAESVGDHEFRGYQIPHTHARTEQPNL